MQTDRKGTVLVIGTYRSTIHATRLLARDGYTVVVARDKQSPSYAECSKYAAEIWDHPSLKPDEGKFLAALADFLSRRPDISLIFPIGDIELLFFARRHSDLPASVAVIMPSASVVEICENKIELMELATKLGVSQAPYALVTSVSDLIDHADGVGYPCVIKASNSQRQIFDKKALICNDKAAVVAALPAWPEGHESLILQRFAFGNRINIHSISQNGKLIGAVQTDVHRTDRPDDTGVEVDSTTAPISEDLRAQCEILSSALHINGMALFQFIVDETKL